MFGLQPDPAEEARREAAFPDGWFALALSRDLGMNAVMSLRAFGRNLVLWRTENGQAHVANSECPHLGADMGRGTLKDDGLVCPIHGLRFDGEGRCLPARPGKPAPSLRLRSYPVAETNGLIAVWRHAAGRAPEADGPSFAELDSADGSRLATAIAEVELSMDAPELDQATLRAREMGLILLATPIEQDRARIIMLSPPLHETGEFDRVLAHLLPAIAFSAG